jgi:hypothetical protein
MIHAIPSIANVMMYTISVLPSLFYLSVIAIVMIQPIVGSIHHSDLYTIIAVISPTPLSTPLL